MSRRKRLEVGPDGQVRIGDPETLKLIADPLRLEILSLLSEPKTAKDVATLLAVPTTRLYYHLRILEERGLIKVVSRRLVSGIEEKTYRSLGTNWVPSPELTDAAIESSGVVGSLVNLVQAELSMAMRSNPEGHIGDTDSAAPVLTLTRLSFDKESLVDFQKKLYALLEEHICEGPMPPEGKELYHIFATAYRYAPITTSTRQPKPRRPRASRS